VGARDKTATTLWPETGELLATGQRVGAGRFTLVDQLGEGGMGVVWLAMDEELSKAGSPFYVALKFLAPRIRSDPRALAMMREEVLQSRRLRHPRVVSIYDWHALPKEPTFISMEYVEGVNLSQLLRLQPDGLMRWTAVAPWMRQLCDALDYAHTEERLVHRDLKPANLMLTQRSDLKLADFGLARAYAGPQAESAQTTTIRGTPLYMGPQQMMGRPPHPTDDLYSLGATLYELLTGTPPFYTGENLLQQVLDCPAEPIAERLARLGLQNDIPARVRMTLASCLAKDAASRPQTARELSHRLGLALTQGQAPASPPAHALSEPAAEEEPAPEPTRRAVGPGMALMLLLMLLVAGGHLFPRSAPVRWLQGWIDQMVGATLGEGGAPLPRPAGPGRLAFEVDQPGAWVRLCKADGSLFCDARLQPDALSGEFRSIPPGDYSLQAEKEGFAPARANVRIHGSRLAHGRLRLVRPSAGRDSGVELGLLYAWPAPVSYVLLDDQGRLVASNSFQREILLTNLAARAYRLLAGLDDFSQPNARLSMPVCLQPGRTNLNLSFSGARLQIYIDKPVSGKVEVRATNSWGDTIAKTLDERSGGAYYHYRLGWLEKAAPGEWSLVISSRPGCEDYVTNVFLAPGAQLTFTNVLEPSRKPWAGLNWTNSHGMALVWFGQPSPGFWACSTETLRKDYAAFVKATGHPARELVSVTAQGWLKRGHTWAQPGFPQSEEEPVVGVSFEDGLAFCDWLSKSEQGWNLRSNQFYTLPSDEQWSAMAGGGRFPWGDEWPPNPAAVNCAGLEVATTNWYPCWPTLSVRQHRDLWERTAPALHGRPNAAGLHHLGGNVAEWCAEWYRKEMNDPALRRLQPSLEIDGGGEVYRLLRGGSWYSHDTNDLAAATRLPAKPDECHDRYGFRVILTRGAAPAAFSQVRP